MVVLGRVCEMIWFLIEWNSMFMIGVMKLMRMKISSGVISVSVCSFLWCSVWVSECFSGVLLVVSIGLVFGVVVFVMLFVFGWIVVWGVMVGIWGDVVCCGENWGKWERGGFFFC